MSFFKLLDEDPAVLKLKGRNYNFAFFYIIKFFRHPTRIFGFIKKIFIFFVNIRVYLKACKNIENTNLENFNSKIYLICLGGLPYQYIQIWNIFHKKVFKEYKLEAISNKNNFLINTFLYFCKIKIKYIEDVIQDKIINITHKDLTNLVTENDYLNYKYNNFEVGKTAIATFFRAKYSGNIFINKEIKKDLDNIILNLIINYESFNKFFSKQNIFSIFITEIFIEQYAAISQAAMNKNLKLVRFNFTVKDDSMIINKIFNENYRRSHASISKKTFENIKSKISEKNLKDFLHSNFINRYSSKWHLSKRNEINKEKLTDTEVYKNLGLNQNKKIGIIFSHILYDLIYAYGNDIYLNYYNWLGNTLKIVEKLDNTQWLLKIHPANAWRYEMTKRLKEISEEERVIDKFCDGKLRNVKIIDYNTKISTLKIMQLSDLCITVRGTSGIEMATMGKYVISAGTGRYEEFDFVNCPKSIDEYESLLKDFNNSDYSKFVEKEKMMKNSLIYYYGLFNCKPIKLPFIKIEIQKFKKKVLSMDDFNYIYDEKNISNLKNLKNYILSDERNTDLIDQKISFQE